MEPRWEGETVRAKERDEELIQLDNMVWGFHRDIYGQLSNPDNEAEFQTDLYKNIDPETA